MKNYFEIVKDSWKFTLKYKQLWLFGLAVEILTGGSIYEFNKQAISILSNVLNVLLPKSNILM